MDRRYLEETHIPSRVGMTERKIRGERVERAWEKRDEDPRGTQSIARVSRFVLVFFFPFAARRTRNVGGRGEEYQDFRKVERFS